MLLALLMSCGTSPDPLTGERCEAISSAPLQQECVLARARADADVEGCYVLPDRWRAECAFEVAEVHAERGDAAAAVGTCALAQPFSSPCLEHVVLILVQGMDGSPVDDVDAIVSAAAALDSAIEHAEESLWRDRLFHFWGAGASDPAVCDALPVGVGRTGCRTAARDHDMRAAVAAWTESASVTERRAICAEGISAAPPLEPGLSQRLGDVQRHAAFRLAMCERGSVGWSIRVRPGWPRAQPPPLKGR